MNFTKSRPAESRLRAPRFRMEKELRVSSRTIGTGVHYQLSTSDISRSGMLLSWRHAINKVPFRENTLLELTIDPDQQLFKEPVHCIGKVVRKINENGKTNADVELGIQIVQIENGDLSEWDLCIDYLTKNAEHLITNNTEYLQKGSEVPSAKNFKRAN